MLQFPSATSMRCLMVIGFMFFPSTQDLDAHDSRIYKPDMFGGGLDQCGSHLSPIITCHPILTPLSVRTITSLCG